MKYSTNTVAVDPNTGRIYASGGLTSDGGPVVKAEFNNELNIIPGSGTNTWINYRGGSSCLYIGNGDASNNGLGNLYANRLFASTELNGLNVISSNILGRCYDVAAGTNLPIVKAVSTTAGQGYNGGAYLGHYNANYDGYWGFATVGFYNDETGVATRNICMAREGGVWTYGETYIGPAGHLYVESGHAYALRNGTWQEFALACDVSGAGMNWIDGTYDSWTSLMGDIPIGRATYGVFVFSPAVSIYDTTTGKTYTTDEIVGTFYRPGAGGMFTGLIRLTGSAGGVRNLSFWFADNYGPNSTWTSIAPIPGTLYGSASSSGINVEGTV